MTIEVDPNHLGLKIQQVALPLNFRPSAVKVGSEIVLADGGLTCEVKQIYNNQIFVECLNDFTLGTTIKSVDIPVLSD